MPSAAVLVAQGAEDLETVTIIDILRRASIKVSVLAVASHQASAVIELAHGCQILTDAPLEEAVENEFDLVVLPGGIRSAHTFHESPLVQQLLSRQLASKSKWVGAICAAPLAISGLLRGQGARLTAYPALRESVYKAASHDESLVFEEGQAVVVSPEHRVITSQGPATAMAFALELVRHLRDGQHADRIAQELLFTKWK